MSTLAIGSGETQGTETLATVGPVEVCLLSRLEDCRAAWIAVEEDVALAGDGPTMRRLLDLSDPGVHADRARLRNAAQRAVPLGSTVLTRGAHSNQVVVHVITRGAEASRERARGVQLCDIFARLLDHCALHGQGSIALHAIGTELAEATPIEVAVQLSSALLQHVQAPTTLRRLEVLAPADDSRELFVNRLRSGLGHALPIAESLPRLERLRGHSWTPPTKSTPSEELLSESARLLSALRDALCDFILELRSRQPNARFGPRPEALAPYLPPDSSVRAVIEGLGALDELALQLRGRKDLVALRGLWRRSVELAWHPMFQGPNESCDPPGLRLLEQQLGLAIATTNEPGEPEPMLAVSELDEWPGIISLARLLLAHEHTRRQIEGRLPIGQGTALERLVRRLATESPVAVLGDLGTVDLLDLAQTPSSGDREAAISALLGRFRHSVPSPASVEGLTTYRQHVASCEGALELRRDRSTLVGSMIDAGSTIERVIRGLLQFHCQARLGCTADRFLQDMHQDDPLALEGTQRASLGSLLRWLQRLDDVLRLPADPNRPPDLTGLSRQKQILPFPNSQDLARLRNLFGHDRKNLQAGGTRENAEEFFRLVTRWLDHLGFDMRPLFPRVVVIRSVQVDDYGRRRYHCMSDDRTEVHVLAHQRLELGGRFFVHSVVPPHDASVLVYPVVVPFEQGSIGLGGNES